MTGYSDRTRFSACEEPPAGKKQGWRRFADNLTAMVDYADPSDDDSPARSGFPDSHYAVGVTRGMP
jgi:hypothetical protein